MPIEKEACKVGLRVQDGNGYTGTVRWIGRMEKAQKPPNKDVGTYAAIEFDMANGKLDRTDGTWEGRQYCQSPPGTVEFIKPRHLFTEMNTAGIAAVRAKYGDAIQHWSDYQVVKFLIARKFDMPKVFVMIDNHLAWRKSFQPSWDEFFPPDFYKYYPCGFGDGLDREGQLIYFERPGNAGAIHPKDFVKLLGLPRILRWHACMMEMGLKRISEHPTARRITMVIDLTRMGDSDRQVLNFGKGLAKIDQDNYPEHLNKMFIINAPAIFTGLWRVIRVFVDDRTKDKIHVYGKDYAEHVEKYIDRKYWPSFMGGSDDSWFKVSGRIGSDDPAKERDPLTGGTINFEEEGNDDIAPPHDDTDGGHGNNHGTDEHH